MRCRRRLACWRISRRSTSASPRSPTTAEPLSSCFFLAVQIGDAPATQAARPDSPSTPGARVLDRCTSVLAGYHPSRRPVGTVRDRAQIGTKTARTSPDPISGLRLPRRGAQGGVGHRRSDTAGGDPVAASKMPKSPSSGVWRQGIARARFAAGRAAGFRIFNWGVSMVVSPWQHKPHTLPRAHAH